MSNKFYDTQGLKRPQKTVVRLKNYCHIGMKGLDDLIIPAVHAASVQQT